MILYVEEDMSPLFMDTGYKSNSPGCLSAEDTQSNTPGSDTEGTSGTKRKQTNRDAARKSRKKQTERADELHEELQGLEQSNSVLQKEIAALKRDLHLYTTALERHEPHCRLRDPAPTSVSVTPLSTSHSADCQAASSPTAAPSPTTSRLPLQMFHATGSTDFSLPAPTATLAAAADSPEVFTFSDSVTVPFSVSTVPAPHSLFYDERSRQRASGDRGSTSGHVLSALDELRAFKMEGDSFPTPSSSAVPPYPFKLEAQGCPVNAPQLRGNPDGSSSFLPSVPQDAAETPLSASLQENPESSVASAFAPKEGYYQHSAANPASLLSRLTVPSPVNVSQTTFCSFDEPQAAALPPPLDNTSRDLSFSEFLDINDWIYNN